MIFYCHNNQNPQELIKFWSKELQLSKNQFTKPYVRQYEVGHVGRRPERMKHGLLHIRYSDSKLLNQLNAWIEEYKIKMGR